MRSMMGTGISDDVSEARKNKDEEALKRELKKRIQKKKKKA